MPKPRPSKPVRTAPVASVAPAPGWMTFISPWIVGVLTFIAFIPALSNQFLDWDDAANFVRNNDFRGLGWANLHWMFTTFVHGHYQPITWLTLASDFLWGRAMFGVHPEYGAGMDPRAFHFTNNLLHSINAALVCLLAQRLIALAIHHDVRAVSRGVAMSSVVAALLWSVHPLRVENVAWITERRDLVSALLLLLTVLAYVRVSTAPAAKHRRWLAISLALYVLSLMSKIAGMPLPFVLILLDWYPLRRFGKGSSHSPKSILVEKLMFLIPSLLFAFIAVRGQAQESWLYPLFKHSMEARIVQSFYGLEFYLRKTVLPWGLLPLYELHMPMNTAEPRFMAAIVAVLLAGVAVAFCAMKRIWPGLVVAALAYCAFLGPVLGLFQNGPQLVADRYSYLPMIAVMIALCGGVFEQLRRRNATTPLRQALVFGACLAIVTLGVLTWRQSRVWHDTESLWQFVLDRDRTSAYANNGLGVYLNRSKNQPAEAVPYFRRAIDIDPYFKNYRENLRYALRQSGSMDALVNAWVEEANFGIKLSGRTEYTAPWFYDQGIQAMNRREFPLAEEFYRTSLAINERQPQVHHNLAAVYEFMNRAEDALAQYRRAVELDPSLVQTQLNLADLLQRMNRIPEAVAALNSFLKVDPSNARAREMLAKLTASQ